MKKRSRKSMRSRLNVLSLAELFVKLTVVPTILLLGFAQVLKATDQADGLSPPGPPVVASLSKGTNGASGAATPAPIRERLLRRSLLRSPGGQLATTATLIVFAFLIASLASRRETSDAEETDVSARHGSPPQDS